MKKLFFSLLLLNSTVIFAQKDRNNVPSSVKQTFQRENPTVRDAQWNQTNGQWHANYKDNNNRNVDAYYDGNGRRRDTHIAWDKKDVPQVVDSRINRTYHANGNYKVERIERPGSTPLFKIGIQTGSKNRTLYMDEQGRARKYNDHH